jgi:hypothetical protein
MQRFVLSAAIIGASVGLCGCNMSSGSSNSTPVAAAPSSGAGAPAWPPLPPAAACTETLNKYQEVLTADVKSGNLNKTVYDQIEADLVRAAGACAAGKDGDAMAIIRSTKEKHGYHA